MADADLASSLRRQQTSLQHLLPLGSYLLKPVQRILKYPILLQVRLHFPSILADDYVIALLRSRQMGPVSSTRKL